MIAFLSKKVLKLVKKVVNLFTYLNKIIYFFVLHVYVFGCSFMHVVRKVGVKGCENEIVFNSKFLHLRS